MYFRIKVLCPLLFYQAPVPTLGHSLTNLRQELKIMIESCIPLETQTTHMFISMSAQLK